MTTTKTQPAKSNPLLFLIIALSVCLIIYGVSKIATPKESANDAAPSSAKITMYVCGYSRCTNSGDYGQLVYSEGINVWNNHDPDRGGVHHQVENGDRVVIIDSTRVEGRTWYKLEDGGWLNDMWLTKQECTPDNLDDYTLNDC